MCDGLLYQLNDLKETFHLLTFRTINLVTKSFISILCVEGVESLSEQQHSVNIPKLSSQLELTNNTVNTISYRTISQYDIMADVPLSCFHHCSLDMPSNKSWIPENSSEPVSQGWELRHIFSSEAHIRPTNGEWTTLVLYVTWGFGFPWCSLMVHRS